MFEKLCAIFSKDKKKPVPSREVLELIKRREQRLEADCEHTSLRALALSIP